MGFIMTLEGLEPWLMSTPHANNITSFCTRTVLINIDNFLSPKDVAVVAAAARLPCPRSTGLLYLWVQLVPPSILPPLGSPLN